MMKFKLWFKTYFKIILVVFLLLLIGSSVWFLFFRFDETASGLSYLRTQKSKDIVQLKNDLATRDQEELEQMMGNGSLEIFDLFRDFLIFGDSRVYGFESYGFFPAENVLADAGHTIMNIDEGIETVKQRQPKNLFFSYGVNDMGLNIGENEGDPGYDVVYEEQIKKLLAVDPEAHVYVNSIIPATPAALQKSPRWDKVDAFNTKIKAMCDRNGWTYIDNDALAQGGQANIYQKDGVHFLQPFYSRWAENIYNTKKKADA